MAKRASNSDRSSWEDRESRDQKRDSKHRSRNTKGRRSYGSKSEMSASKSSNDPAWYSKDEALLRDSASYPFAYPVGRPINLKMDSGQGFDYNVPGIMSFEISPCIGNTASPSDPVNVAANAVYSWVRHANSGHKNYDAPDLMIYMLAMSQVYSYLNWAQRLYGYATLYDQKNRYMPKALIEANGVNPDSIINNLANYRYRLNVLINKVAAMAVPNTFTLFNRMAFIYQNVFIEGGSTKDQLYQYVPKFFLNFQYDDTAAGCLRPTSNLSPLNPITWDVVISMGEQLIGSIWGEEDFGIMSGDILKCYGDNIIKIAPLPEFYPIMPVYDEVVLTQMKNCIPVQLSNNSCNVDQDAQTGFLKCNPAFTAANYTWCFGLILTINATAPGPDLVMESTRLAPAVSANTKKVYCGSEVCTNVWICRINTGTQVSEHDIVGDFPNLIDFNGAPVTGPFKRVTKEIMLKSFKYAPMFWIQHNEGDETLLYPMLEVDNYTYLEFEDLRKLHEAAWLNMLSVPSVGKA